MIVLQRGGKVGIYHMEYFKFVQFFSFWYTKGSPPVPFGEKSIPGAEAVNIFNSLHAKLAGESYLRVSAHSFRFPVNPPQTDGNGIQKRTEGIRVLDNRARASSHITTHPH